MTMPRLQIDEEKRALFVHQGLAKLPFGNEYYGPGQCFVYTPETERCRLAMVTAMSLNTGCLLLGPAGSGKRGAAGDLARSLGRCAWRES